MKFSRRQASWVFMPALLSMLLAGHLPQALGQNQSSTDATCKAYVQKFYNWYVKESSRDGKESPDMRAIKNKDFNFSEDMIKALKEDQAASANSKGEVAGLDFDPFLNSQEQPERYVAEKVSRKGDHYLVTVYSFAGGKKEAKPAVTPELEYKSNRWTFVNFHYGKSDIPENENLMLVLKGLSTSRAPHK